MAPGRATELGKRRRQKNTTAEEGLSLFEGEVRAGGGSGSGDESDNGQVVALDKTAQSRYLNYALSVITSRALPDVRDGLKPVQRRILYTMWQQNITADARHRKCAKVVGDVMGNYHPHGDMAIYDALVRMAQPFAMRAVLIDGSGNFGSLDGDNAAAMRYTECRLMPIAGEILQEIDDDTVHHRPNYDGSRLEPVVLPARIPNLLVNGATGIAVGMATNIPPHNLAEVCNALIKLLDNPELKTYQLCATDGIRGPDFPTGGQILNTRDELREIYKSGSGAIRLRATWKAGPTTRAVKKIHITSVPYAVNKANLVEAIAQVVLSRKMPLIVDVRDLSTEEVCIELDLKKDADEQKVMAYLFKHTPLQMNFNVNLTCLIPTENPEVGRPERCDLREILSHFLQFRMDVVVRRLENELAGLNKRIHILEGFALVFDAMDEIIRIIRKSDGKAHAAKKIMARFKQLDAEQTDAILELKLYRLAKLEIQLITDELTAKRKRGKEIEKLLKSEESRWSIVRSELEEVRDKYGKSDPGSKRRTLIESATDEPEFSAEDFIVDEDNQVIVTRDGWIKRQKDIRDPSTTRLREGDSVLTAQAGSTRAPIAFLSNFGTAYTCRIIDVPASTGYGEPIQKLFKLKDGERIVAAFSLDPRAIGDVAVNPRKPDKPAKVHGLAVASDGYAVRFNLEPLAEISTRSGRRYARPGKGAEIIGVEAVHGPEIIIAASQSARAMLCSVEEVNYLTGVGRGVILMKLGKDDRLLGCKASSGDRDLLRVETSRGAEQTISTAKYGVTGRGGKGREVMKTGKFIRVIPDEAIVLALG